MNIKKLEDITEPGFYWNRLDEHRMWSVVYVVRQMINPLHPRYNMFKIESRADSRGGWVSELGDFIGPLDEPE